MCRRGSARGNDAPLPGLPPPRTLPSHALTVRVPLCHPSVSALRTMSTTPKGFLVVKVLEAAGHNSSDVRVWDPSFTEGFVKGAPARLLTTAANASASGLV